MESIARKFAIGMVMVATSTLGMAAFGGEAHASETRDVTKCADAIASPTDARCEEFVHSAMLYHTIDNDVYSALYQRELKQTPGRARILLRAAQARCDDRRGEDSLAEDFSCVPADFYDETDYKPVKAAIG